MSTIRSAQNDRVRAARAHPHPVTIAAFAIAILTMAAIAIAYGVSAFDDAWRQPHWPWLILCLAAEAVAVGAYAAAYATVSRMEGGRWLAPPLLLRLVLAGFGPFTVAGGFALDRLGGHRRSVRGHAICRTPSQPR